MVKPVKNASVFGQLTGDKELDKALALLPAAAEKKVVRPALRDGAKVALVWVKNYTPRESGALEQSLKVKAVPRSRTKIGSRIMIGDGFFKGDQFYGPMQELGWRPGKRPSNRSNKKVPGKAFMRRGLYYSEDIVLQKVSQTSREKLPIVILQLRKAAKS